MAPWRLGAASESYLVGSNSGPKPSSYVTLGEFHDISDLRFVHVCPSGGLLTNLLAGLCEVQSFNA